MHLLQSIQHYSARVYAHLWMLVRSIVSYAVYTGIAVCTTLSETKIKVNIKTYYCKKNDNLLLHGIILVRRKQSSIERQLADVQYFSKKSVAFV